MKTYDCVIIGGGVVGAYALVYAKMLGLNTLLLEKTQAIGGKLLTYPHKIITDLPGFCQIKATEFVDLIKRQIIDNDCENNILLETEVKKFFITNDTFRIITNHQFEVNAYKVIIASGTDISKPIKLSIPNDLSIPIFYHAQKIPPQTKNIIILGGGDQAVEAALDFFRLNYQVTIIHRRGCFRARSELVSLLPKNIEIFLNHQVLFIKDGCLYVQNQVSDRVIKFQDIVIFVAYGFLVSNNLFHEGLKLDSNGIIVDQCNMSNITNVYVIGD